MKEINSGEKKEGKLHDRGLGNLLTMTTKAQVKEKNRQIGLIRIKNFHASKATIDRIQMQFTK